MPCGQGLGKLNIHLQVGKSIAKRQKVQHESIRGISKNSIRKLARRGGVYRMGGGVSEEIKKILSTFLTKVIGDAVLYTGHANRKTVTQLDVIYALKKQGRTLYI